MINAKFIKNTSVKLSDECRNIMGSSRDGQIYELGMVEAFYNRMKARNPNAIYLDIGANTGSYALLPLIDENITCYAFEPNPKSFDVLTENVSINNLNNKVKIYNIGMWYEESKLELKVPLDTTDSGLSTFGDNPSRFKYSNKSGEFGTHLVNCKTIDDIVKELNLPHVDAIKIDTEGAELNILKGGVKLLKEQKPLILLEYDDKNTTQFGYKRKDISDFLKTIGYEHFTMYQLSDIFVY